MALPRQKFREIVLYLLFGSTYLEEDSADCIELVMEQLKVSKSSVKEALEFTKHVAVKLAEVDQLIKESTTEYDFARICELEKTVLRLGCYEMLYDDMVPEKVAIAEAIRLTRKFSTAESGNFVNAILDAIFKKKMLMSPIA